MRPAFRPDLKSGAPLLWSTVHRFLVLLFENNDVIGVPNKILPRTPRVLSVALARTSKKNEVLVA